MKIYAVIVTYNGEKWINNCLSSLKASLFPIYPIVIDNASTDSTKEILENYPEIKFLPMSKNLGFGRANNIGIRYAIEQKADYILLLNQDAWIENNVIEELINLFISHPEYGILSPIHFQGNKINLDEGFATYTGLSYTPAKNEKSILKEVDFINAAIWLLPTKVFLNVGGFDPMYPHYGEDYDFIQRIHYHGYKVGYSPILKGYHDRECRKAQTKQQRLSRDFVYFLNVAKNINLSSSKSWYKIYKEAFYNGVKNKQLAAYLKIIGILTKNRKQIKLFRKLVSQKGNHFLSEKEICYKPLSYS